MTKQPSLAGNWLRGKKYPEEAVEQLKRWRRTRIGVGILAGAGTYLLARLFDQSIELAALIGLGAFIILVLGPGMFHG